MQDKKEVQLVELIECIVGLFEYQEKRDYVRRYLSALAVGGQRWNRPIEDEVINTLNGILASLEGFKAVEAYGAVDELFDDEYIGLLNKELPVPVWYARHHLISTYGESVGYVLIAKLFREHTGVDIPVFVAVNPLTFNGRPNQMYTSDPLAVMSFETLEKIRQDIKTIIKNNRTSRDEQELSHMGMDRKKLDQRLSALADKGRYVMELNDNLRALEGDGEELPDKFDLLTHLLVGVEDAKKTLDSSAYDDLLGSLHRINRDGGVVILTLVEQDGNQHTVVY